MIIGILNYGVGNIGSLINVLKKIGVETLIINNENDLHKSDGIIFPGVGSFNSAIKILRKYSITNELKGVKPILGICLGMQIFFEKSEEGIENGLSWFSGIVKKFRYGKIPHIGWNDIKIIKQCSLTQEIPNNSYFYFAHSYAYFEIDKEFVVGVTEYYGQKFASIVCDEKNLVYGTQFHPEKSSKIGLKLLQNFVKICRK